MIADLLKELNQYYSNIITALATVIYMIFTGWLIWETRKTRKLQEKPHIEIFVKRANSWWSMLDLVIKNIWYSGAYNIELDTDKDLNLLDNDIYRLKNLWFFKNWISFLPVNWEIINTFTILSTNYSEKIKWKIHISCFYKDKFWETIKDVFLIDLSMFEDTFVPQEEPIYKIERSIWKIEKSLDKISRWFPKLNVVTQTKKEHTAELKQKQDELNDFYKNNWKQ